MKKSTAMVLFGFSPRTISLRQAMFLETLSFSSPKRFAELADEGCCNNQDKSDDRNREKEKREEKRRRG